MIAVLMHLFACACAVGGREEGRGGWREREGFETNDGFK